ncbi:hypothetical protein NEOLEDRAFT_662764 [Neolentinus lepideus HHB14362 ss-1]|uniref:Uncharacterized protein n=1 Tax=Neolentinus lepideus HHB14362 ss-1 TaxID=1314782 RepID=A0A165QH76_9AGAM|nr:hypothetical protein NEOLEDRAFT_662764 [Neolentinus lepideus HHB14362 ss-1]
MDSFELTSFPTRSLLRDLAILLISVSLHRSSFAIDYPCLTPTRFAGVYPRTCIALGAPWCCLCIEASYCFLDWIRSWATLDLFGVIAIKMIETNGIRYTFVRSGHEGQFLKFVSSFSG